MGGEEKVGGEAEDLGFSILVLMFRTSGLIALGHIPDPITQERKKDLDQVKQSISLLEMLESKTKGNLTPAEEQELATVLYELRTGYLQELQEK
jgi:hypothetical protein